MPDWKHEDVETAGLTSVAVSPNFPAFAPGPCFGMHIDTERLNAPLNCYYLQQMGMTEQHAFSRAAENLRARSAEKLRVGTFGPSPSDMLSIDLNIMEGRYGRILLGLFRDPQAQHQSVRIFLPGMAGTVAKALGIPQSQLVAVVTFARGINVTTPLYAADCTDLASMLEMFEFVHYEGYAPGVKKTALNTLECSPLLITRVPAPFSPHFVKAQPYPGLAQQVALRIGEAVYMPWPVDRHQCRALRKHGKLVMLQSLESGALGSCLPIMTVKACFGCGTGAQAGAPEIKSVCARCQHARYCSRACQEKDWQLHKHFCKCYKEMYSF